METLEEKKKAMRENILKLKQQLQKHQEDEGECSHVSK